MPSGFFMPAEITLSSEQYDRAMTEAERRQAVNEEKGLKARNRAPSKGEAALELHRLGCTGELAVAVFLGLEEDVFMEKEARRGSADLPGALEIKSRKKHGYDLLIQLSDSPDKLFVLTTCDRVVDPLRVVLAGWAYGSTVMRKEFIRELVRGRPCYVVPNNLLQPIETLKEELCNPAGPGRILGPEDAWLTQDGEDMLLNLSETLALELGWKPGDMLSWTAGPETGSCSIAKSPMINLQATFEKFNNDFGEFNRVDQSVTGRQDLFVFLLLDKLMPGQSDIISWTGHDEIGFSADCDMLAQLATEDEILTLVRCGVTYNEEHHCLSMFI